MAEQKITIEFDKYITDFIKSNATRFGCNETKDFMEMIIIDFVFYELESRGPSKAKH